MESGSTSNLATLKAQLLLLILFVLVPDSAMTGELPREFSANYALQMYGTTLARALYTLEHTENGLAMTQSTRPIGLLSLLRNEKIDVRSDMVFENGKLLLVSYDYRHTGDNKDRDVRFKIDWQNHEQDLVGTATGVYEGRNVNLKIDQPVWDPLSIQVPIMIDAAKKFTPHQHGLFMKGEFRHYLFENHGTETVKFNGRQLDALKIAGREINRDRAMYVWMAPELHNIPIIIEQWKNGELKSTVILESVTFDTYSDNIMY